MKDSFTWQNAILESTDYIVLTIGLEGNILSCNIGALQKLGFTEEEVIGKSPMIFHDPEEVKNRAQELAEELHCSIEPVEVFIAKANKGLLPDESEWNYICKNGTRFIGHLSVTALKDETGSISGFLGIGRDITKQKNTEKTLHEYEMRFHAFMNNSPAISFIKDIDGRYIFVNKQFLTLVNFSQDEILGKTVEDILPSEVATLMRQSDEKVLRTGESLSLEETITAPDGTISTWLTLRFPLTDGAGQRLIGGVSVDITQRIYYEQRLEDYQLRLEEAIAQLESVAATDSLSGLKNKGAFVLRLDEEIARATRYDRPLSLLILDIDKFKEYNDSFGHPAGDDALKAISDVMRDCARPGDSIARVGGEEFAIILSNTPIQGAYVVGERLRRAVENASWPLRRLTVSVGVAELSSETQSRAALYEAADTALYRAKRTGRNQVLENVM